MVARRLDRAVELVADLARARLPRRLDHRGDGGEVGDQLRVGRSALEAFRIFLGDEVGRDVAAAEARVLHQRGEEIDVVADAVDLERVERRDLRVDRRFAGRRPGDQLGDHRVVEHRHLAAFEHAVVDADAHAVLARLGRRAVADEAAGRGQEAAIRVLGIDAVLDRPAVRASRRPA